jgi:hypothetical protein
MKSAFSLSAFLASSLLVPGERLPFNPIRLPIETPHTYPLRREEERDIKEI